MTLLMMMMIRGINLCPSDLLWGGGDKTPASLRASSPCTLKAEAPVSFETSGTARPTTQRHVRDALCLPDVSNGSGCGQGSSGRLL